MLLWRAGRDRGAPNHAPARSAGAWPPRGPPCKPAGGPARISRQPVARRKGADASAMDIFVQQLINGITLGSIYGLIAIGYTMVFGIIGMVNFAHGDVFMVSAFIALIALLILTSWLGIVSVALALFIVLIVAMLFTSLINWVIERVAYRPLRGSFRLAPLISAIGMSITLSNFVQVTQGPRNKSIPPLVQGEFILSNSNDFPVTLSYKQLIIWGITAVLLLALWVLVARTRLGRAHHAAAEDVKNAG